MRLVADFPPRRLRFAPVQVMLDLWWTKWHWGRFSPSTSGFSANHHSTKFSILIITRGRYDRPIGDRSRYFFIQVTPQLSSRGWVDPVPDPLLLRKYGKVGNRTQDLWLCSQKLWPLDHRGAAIQYSLTTFDFLNRAYNKSTLAIMSGRWQSIMHNRSTRLIYLSKLV
jgi:hypothetical protein